MRAKFPPRARHGLVAEPNSAGRYQISSAKAIRARPQDPRRALDAPASGPACGGGRSFGAPAFVRSPRFIGDLSMFNSKNAVRAAGAVVLAGTLLIAAGASAQQPKPAPAPSAEEQRMSDIGIAHKTAAGLYQYLKEQAHGGKPLDWRSVPDWTG